MTMLLQRRYVATTLSVGNMDVRQDAVCADCDDQHGECEGRDSKNCREQHPNTENDELRDMEPRLRRARRLRDIRPAMAKIIDKTRYQPHPVQNTDQEAGNQCAFVHRRLRPKGQCIMGSTSAIYSAMV